MQLPTQSSSSARALAQAERPNRLVDCGCSMAAPHQTAGAPWWMFLGRIGNKTKFFFFFFFFSSQALSMGNFPRTSPLLFHRDVYPLQTLWVVFQKYERKRKRKEKTKIKLVMYHLKKKTTINCKKESSATIKNIWKSHPEITDRYVYSVFYCQLP